MTQRRDRTRPNWRAIRDEVGDVDTGGLVERHPRLATLLPVLAGSLDTLLLGNSLVGPRVRFPFGRVRCESACHRMRAASRPPHGAA